jgi:hypothetical protein
MHIKHLGNVLIVLGVVVLLASLFADTIGIGGNPDFGPGQITGVIFGPVISFIGFNVKGQAD